MSPCKTTLSFSLPLAGRVSPRGRGGGRTESFEQPPIRLATLATFPARGKESVLRIGSNARR
jgi:hypothetical protein